MTTANDYAAYLEQKAEIDKVKSARVRLWGMGIGVFLTGPIASCIYSVKTSNWIPTLIGTGVAVVGIPLAAVDLGITSAFAAPAATITLFAKKTLKDRRELSIITPEQADCLLWKKNAD